METEMTPKRATQSVDGSQRRQAIIDLLKLSKEPLSGTTLGRKFNVSRQVIVQDIALLRITVPEILSTHRGYSLTEPNYFVRIFKVRHTTKEIKKELNVIVDAGGRVIDVFVHHSLYGKLTAPLRIYSRLDVCKFVEQVESKGIRPLNLITGGEHYHTVEADSEEILDAIEQTLKDEGLLSK